MLTTKVIATAVDENTALVVGSWTSTHMARMHGQCRRGDRLVMAVPDGHWKTTTFVAALRADGMTAPTVIDGAVTSDLFVAYVEQQLCPVLRRGTWW